MSERPGEFDHLALSQSAGGGSSAGAGPSAPSGGDFLEVSDSAGSSGAIPPSSEVAPPGPVVEGQYPRIEGYRIIGRLGAGGMGVVYRAIQLGTQREVALKLMAAHVADQEKDRKRFEREVQLSARLEHPNIARVYDSGLHRGAYYYAMELVDGRDLETYVNEEGLSQQDTLRLVAAICRAVEYAHAHGVIHKDLKPANILVTRDGQPHIMDFGLARAFHDTDHGLTVSLSGEATGTPAYMSPEQAAGKVSEIDHRTDTYSLGVILYRLLVKQYPRDMTGPLYQVLRRIAEEDVQTPRQMNVHLDGPLEALLLKALARDPGGRYPTAAEFAGAIEQYVGTIRIPEATLAPRRRGRRGSFALAGVFLCLVALAGAVRYELLPVPEAAQPWLTWLMRAKPGELDRIKQQADQAWKTVAKLDRGQGFGELLDSAATQQRVAKVLLGQNKHADAKEAYDQLASECAQIQQRQEQRQTAGKVRADAEAQAKIARDANAAELAKSQWDAAQSLMHQGESEYGAGKFEVAAGLWKSAREMLGEAKTAAGVTSLKRKAEQAWTAAKALDRGQGFDAKLGAIETGLQATSSLAEGKQYPKAEEGYKALLAKCDELQALQKLRQQARDANTAAQKLRDAVPAEAKTVAKVAWDKAQTLLAQAAAAFEQGRFEDAARLWKESEPLFATVTASKDEATAYDQARSLIAPAARAAKEEEERQAFAKLTAEVRRVLVALPSDPVKTTGEHRQQVQTGLRAIQAALVYKPADTDALALKAKLEAYLGSAKELALDLGGGVSLKCVLIPAGKFLMGSPEGEKDRSSDEGPQREVTISKPFHMGITEVTQGQWSAVMGTTPWKDKEYVKDGAEHAASYISWNDANEFCAKLSRRTGKTVRLPTEAEWEYACRAGSTMRFCYGDDDDCGKLGDYAWYDKNAWDIGNKYAHPVGGKKPNACGLYDMHGNVWEWCSDWYADSYAKAKNQDPQGPESGTYRVLRGGSFFSFARICRSAIRHYLRPVLDWRDTGLRVVVSVGMDSPAPTAANTSVPPTLGELNERALKPDAWAFDANEAARRQTQAAKAAGVPRDQLLDLGGGVSLKCVLIPAGKFTMGSTKEEQETFTKSAKEAGIEGFNLSDEGPQREVTISRPFYMGTFEVTREQFAAFVSDTSYKTDAEKDGWAYGWDGKAWAKIDGASWKKPGFDQNDDHPVVDVSWNDAEAFCLWLAKKTGRAVRLPTEAQWEYACRAGTKTAYQWGDDPDDGKGWCNGADQTAKKDIPVKYIFNWADGYTYTAPVGRFKANAFGLYDMHGNAWEWCSDWYADSYANAKVQDPQGPNSGSLRVLRGGGWDFNPAYCRSATRGGDSPGGRGSCVGFRVALDLE